MDSKHTTRNEIELDSLQPSEAIMLRNEYKVGKPGDEPCAICKSPCNTNYRIHLVNYGTHITDSEIEGEDSTGWHMVGSTCFSKVKKAFGGKYPTPFKGR